MNSIEIYNHNFILHPSGAIFWLEKKTLFLADVHLGKVAHFRKNVIAVPRKAEGLFYEKITKLLNDYTPTRIIFLGDLFHSEQNNEWYLFESWVKKQNLEIILIEGNHDIIPKLEYNSINVKILENLIEDKFYFTHLPIHKKDYFVFCGHIHPGVKLKGSGLQQMKMPCFFKSKDQLILPAFGGFTGLHILSPTKDVKVYITTGKEVMEMS